FNARRTGGTWRDTNPYLFLISISWPAFIGIVAVAYVVLNLIFAGLYAAVGMENIKGTEAPTAAWRFLNIFFFSAHTLSTVGHGNMWASGAPANSIAALEAQIGRAS